MPGVLILGHGQTVLPQMRSLGCCWATEISLRVECIVRVSVFFKNRSVVLIKTMSGCDRELNVHFLLCRFTLVSRCTHFTLYQPSHIIYYSENMCTNQEATSTSDTQAVNACTCARISEQTTVFNLNFVEEHENGAEAKSRVSVLLKTISKCN